VEDWVDETLDTGTQAGKPSRTDELIGLLSNKIVGQAHALEHIVPSLSRRWSRTVTSLLERWSQSIWMKKGTDSRWWPLGGCPGLRSFLRRYWLWTTMKLSSGGLEHMLAEEGHTVLVASSAEAAMDRIEETVPDILLLDHILPDGEGVHLAVQLMKRFPQARVVVMSGAQFDEEEQLLCQRYDIPFLQKPFVAEELLGALEAILLSGGSSRSAMA
jgi:two-component system response regulator VicR